MPNLTSNIPINQTYGVFYSQIVRIFDANTGANLFIDNLKALLSKLCYQGFKGGVQAWYFEKHDFSLGLKEEGQDTSRHFANGFGSMRVMLPKWSLGAKKGQKLKS